MSDVCKCCHISVKRNLKIDANVVFECAVSWYRVETYYAKICVIIFTFYFRGLEECFVTQNTVVTIFYAGASPPIPICLTTFVFCLCICLLKVVYPRSWPFEQAWIKVGIGHRHCTTVGLSVSHLSLPKHC